MSILSGLGVRLLENAAEFADREGNKSIYGFTRRGFALCVSLAGARMSSAQEPGCSAVNCYGLPPCGAGNCSGSQCSGSCTAASGFCVILSVILSIWGCLRGSSTSSKPARTSVMKFNLHLHWALQFNVVDCLRWDEGRGVRCDMH